MNAAAWWPTRRSAAIVSESGPAMSSFDVVLLLVTAAVAGGAVYWACQELGGALEWFTDGSEDLRPLLTEADLVAAREELLSR